MGGMKSMRSGKKPRLSKNKFQSVFPLSIFCCSFANLRDLCVNAFEFILLMRTRQAGIEMNSLRSCFFLGK